MTGKITTPTPAFSNRIHQHDCARVIAHLLGGDQIPEVLVATDDCPVVDNEVRQWLAEQLGVNAEMAEINPSVTANASGKRLSNARLKALGFEFEYPSYRQGYPAIVQAFLAQQQG